LFIFCDGERDDRFFLQEGESAGQLKLSLVILKRC